MARRELTPTVPEPLQQTKTKDAMLVLVQRLSQSCISPRVCVHPEVLMLETPTSVELWPRAADSGCYCCSFTLAVGAPSSPSVRRNTEVQIFISSFFTGRALTALQLTKSCNFSMKTNVRIVWGLENYGQPH